MWQDEVPNSSFSFQHKCLKKVQGKWTVKSRKGRPLHISLSIQIQSVDNKSNDSIWMCRGIALQCKTKPVI